MKGLAICLNQLGRPQSAWEIMQRAANLNLQPLETHYYLGHILRSLGKTTEALEELRLAKEFAISDYADHLNQQLIISKIEKETRELAAEN
ncbi:MAG: hypothetical protein R3A13_03745 [Bdellovibrionota bacterium]